LTVITVKQPLQIQDKLLQPGKYVLRLFDGTVERSVVQVFNGDQTRIVDTFLTIPIYRSRPTGRTVLTIWETPPGTAQALRDWYYPGDNYGEEFRYPKQPVALTASLNMAPASRTAEPVAAAAPAPGPTSVAEEPHTEMAAAVPAPAPEPAPAPKVGAAPEPAGQSELPKTASPYPTVGLGGLLMVGLYGLSRWRRTVYLR
jgi:hypothetical protein